jgi:hypothetical protein
MKWNYCANAQCKAKVEMKQVGNRLVGKCMACGTKQSERTNEK